MWPLMKISQNIWAYNLLFWVKLIKHLPNVDTISWENIDSFTKWAAEFERPIMEEATLWLELEEEQLEHVHRIGKDLDEPFLLVGGWE